MNPLNLSGLTALFLAVLALPLNGTAQPLGVGAKPIPGAEVPIDGSRRMLDEKYFNGKKVHTNVPISQVWGGANSGLDGGNDGGQGITDTPGGLKLQCEGHDVRYRNAWIKELDLKEANTDF